MVEILLNQTFFLLLSVTIDCLVRSLILSKYHFVNMMMVAIICSDLNNFYNALKGTKQEQTCKQKQCFDDAKLADEPHNVHES